MPGAERVRLVCCTVVLAALTPACGGLPTAPTIDNLRLSPPDGIRPGEALTIAVDFEDEDGDLPAGSAEVAIRQATEADGQVYRVPLGGESGKKGKLSFTVVLPGGAVPGTYDLGVTAIDAAGRRSAPLVGTFDVVID